jgi:hypothetical protein
MVACQPEGSARAARPEDCFAASSSSEPNAELLRHLQDEHEIFETVSKILATGDPVLRERAAAQLVLFVTTVGGTTWRESHRERLAAADRLSKLAPTPAQFEEQLDQYQEMELQRLYRPLAALGGEAAMDYAFDEASDTASSIRRRRLAVDLAENLLRSGARRHAEQLPVLAEELRHVSP